MGLTKVFLCLIALVFATTLFVPLVTAFCSRLNDPAPWTAAAYVTCPALALVLAGVGLLFGKRSEEFGLLDKRRIEACLGRLEDACAMYFGVQFLYWLAAGLYASAFLSSLDGCDASHSRSVRP